MIYTCNQIQENEHIKNYYAFIISNLNFNSNVFTVSLAKLEEVLQVYIDFFEMFLDYDDVFIVIDSHLYKGYIAKSEINFNNYFSISYKTKGGSHSFENALINIFVRGYDSFYNLELATFDENTNETFKLCFSINSNEYAIEYNKVANQIEFFNGSNTYTGLITKLEPGKEFSILFDNSFIYFEFNFVNTDDIQKITTDFIKYIRSFR